MKMPEKRNIFGVNVLSIPMEEVLKVLNERVAKKAYNKPLFVTTVNVEFVMLAQEDTDFKRILNTSDLAIADGFGLRLKGVGHVVAGRKLVEALVTSKMKVFYLGGRKGVAKKMALKYGGEFDEGSSDIKSEILNSKDQINTNTQIINKINMYKPDVLLVAYGAPWQEKWIARNLDKLKAQVVMGVGGSFDYLTGKVPVPPDWVNKMGFEWLWRLVREPWRWRRQLNLIKFAWKVCCGA